jgi:hypothetical protein
MLRNFLKTYSLMSATVLTSMSINDGIHYQDRFRIEEAVNPTTVWTQAEAKYYDRRSFINGCTYHVSENVAKSVTFPFEGLRVVYNRLK